MIIYLKLFWAFFQIGAFSIGGGYAAMPMIQSQVVTEHNWLTMSEFADVVTIAEMTPGPIAINSATFVGSRVAGISGSIIATIGCILPSCVIVIALAALYKKYKKLAVVQEILGGLRPAIAGMVAYAAISLVITSFWGDSYGGNINVISALILAGGVLIMQKWRVSPIMVLILSGAVGLVAYSSY